MRASSEVYIPRQLVLSCCQSPKVLRLLDLRVFLLDLRRLFLLFLLIVLERVRLFLLLNTVIAI